MAIKIYSEGGSVVIDDGEEVQISSFSYYEEDSETVSIVNNDKQTNAWNDFYYNIQTKSGAQAGATMALTLDYLSELLSSSALLNRVTVTQSNFATTIGGVIDSTKDYFIDGIIDIGTTQVTVPSTGMTITGYSFDLSALTSTENNYTMFIDSSGSGNVLMTDIFLTTSGTTSKVFNLTDSNGFHAIEFNRVNYIDCTSLGELTNYRQGLELGTGRFGGSPSFTLTGTWIGGYRITTSIVRSMSDTTTEPLFKAGTAFVMNSRFLTDINCDLGTLQPFCDFTTANFPNPSSVQVKGAIISRDGVFDSNDSNIFTNLTNSDLASDFDNNIGIDNTFVGGRAFVSSENLTTIAAGSTYYTLNGVWGANNLQHFDSPSGGQLRHLGNNPREFKVTVNFIIESTANNDVGIRLRKWDDSASSFSEFNERARQINSFVGGRDVGFYNFSFNVTLDQNDYIYFQVRNNSGNNNLTLELNSDFLIEER